MKDYKDHIRSYIDEEIRVMQALDINEINKAMNKLEETRQNGSTVYICGNGGSASTASHFTGDFNKGVSMFYDKKYNFICLNDNTATMMAVANDLSYNDIFRFPLEGRMTSDDILIAVSGSGNSENVVKAVKYAKKIGATVIGVTGYNGGKLKQLSDINLHVPVDNMQVTEDLHLMFDHLMMHILAYKCRAEDAVE